MRFKLQNVLLTGLCIVLFGCGGNDSQWRIAQTADGKVVENDVQSQPRTDAGGGATPPSESSTIAPPAEEASGTTPKPSNLVDAAQPTTPPSPTPSAPNPLPSAPDLPAAALAWLPTGGSATISGWVSNPLLQLSPSISLDQRQGVSQGRELFIAQWLPAPSNRPTLDGLGPLFNADACTACHASDGRIAPYNPDGTTTPAVLFRIGNAKGEAHPIYGGQLQSFATAGVAEGVVRWARSTTTGLLEFVLTLLSPKGANDMQGYSLGARISPHLQGMGLLDLVPTSQILEWTDEMDANADGISGRAHWVTEGRIQQLGRFGWKAINATLRTQNAGALHQDMGLTTPVNPSESCTSAQSNCALAPSGGSPEVTEEALSAIVDFMTALAVPDRRIPTGQQAVFDQGAKIFERIGCANCHRPSLTTGVSTRFPSLSNQKIYPYTDLLLHDMGLALSDGIKELDAAPSEWRTPPLWGIGLVEAKPGARFLHDGRADSIPAAIAWHGGEAQTSKSQYMNLQPAELNSLLAFVRGI